MFDPGHILVDLCERRDERIVVTICNTRTAQVAHQLMQPASRANARRLISLVYGLCPIAHLCAFDAARAAAAGVNMTELRRRTAAFPESALALEAMIENLRVMTLEVEHLLPDAPHVTADLAHAKRLGSLRGRLQTIVHMLGALDPLRTNDPEAWIEAHESIDQAAPEIREAFGSMLFGMPADAWLSGPGRHPQALRAWAQAHAGELPAAAWLHKASSHGESWGAVSCELLPTALQVMDELGARMLSEQGFALAPRWQHSPRLTGAYARMAHSALFKPFAERGPDAFTLSAARLMECALGPRLLQGGMHARMKRFDALEAAGTPLAACARTSEGAVGTAESARGLLTHAIATDAQGEPERLAITSPTEWQFAPEGPAARVAADLVRRLCGDTPKGERCRHLLEQNLREALFGLDACVPVVFQHRSTGGPDHA